MIPEDYEYNPEFEQHIIDGMTADHEQALCRIKEIRADISDLLDELQMLSRRAGELWERRQFAIRLNAMRAAEHALNKISKTP